ncbi:MAG: hypothetical protein J6V80_00600 [Clostridia bacterium]|nr:hypothetical protein [Clostridia bacterium]
MIDIERSKATLLSALIAILVIILVYTLFTPVDLVFMNGEDEVAYKANVMIFSDLELDAEDIKCDNCTEGKGYTYTSGGQQKDFNADFGFRLEIAKTTLTNFFTFNWTDDANVIVLQAK